jgi:antibiotic biosynthesis monooxygenase (ABM) superfamily enzyme
MTAKRIRHGWTTTANAEAYQALLLADIFPTIEARAIPGFRSFELLRGGHAEEVEFVTVMTFDEFQGVLAFQGR